MTKKLYLISICTLNFSLISAEHNFFDKKENGVEFPPGFFKGTSCSTYQNGGHRYSKNLGYTPTSNWTWFENTFKARFIIDRKRQHGPSFWFTKSSPIDRGETVGIAADGWNRMLDDVQLIKNLNCNAHRFEMPWTDLNPKQGFWNEEVFAFFDTYIDTLLDNGIEPIITLYHWVHPQWFSELGGWEDQKNTIHFVRYCQEVFKRYGHKVRYWCTINEPTTISICGYILGSHAPGKKDYASMLRPFCKDFLLSYFPHNYRLAGTVLGNLFKAHIDVYETLKAMPHGDKAHISIIHQLARFNAHLKIGIQRFLNPISRLLAAQFNKNFAHKTFMTFFQTGHFLYQVPGEESIEFIDTRAPKSLDFVGLNFYSYMFFGPAPEGEPGDIMTDMLVWAIRPQDIYHAIQEMSQFKVPIIITENGICDEKDDRREKWIVGYGNAVDKAIQDGYDVRGYCYWSLLDNFEWNMGHNKKFGLYAVNTLSNNCLEKNRVLREGAKAYRDYIKVPHKS